MSDRTKRAFPMEFADGTYNAGMTLRDWFAGQALAGIVTLPGLDEDECAEMAWKQADVMLQQRDE